MELTGPVLRVAVTVTRAGEELAVTSSSVSRGVRNTVSVLTAPASAREDGTAGTAHWRAAVRTVEVTGSVGRTRRGSGPAAVRTAGGVRGVRGERRLSARTR